MEEEEVKPIKLKCKHCGYEWDYKGKAKYYTSCPRCLYKVRIRREEG